MPSNDEFLSLLGETLLWHAPSNTYVKPVDALADRTVLIYFSASWCSPCARFTPKLLQTYDNLKQRGEHVEIVLCSLDQVLHCYESYTTKLPWLAVPYHSQALTQRLMTKFEANHGIPHVAIIRPNGTMLDVDDAVHQITLDPQGTQFPWPARPLCDMVPPYVDRYSSTSSSSLSSLSLSGEVQLEQISTTTWHDKYLMLYFAAHWSAPCRDFGPKLNQIYETLKSHRDDFELLLVSGDRSDDEYQKHLAELSFCAVPFQDESCRVALTRRFKIRDSPALVMLGPGEREIINDKVLLLGDYIGNFPYHPKLYGDFHDSTMDMNDNQCILIFCEEADSDVQAHVVTACKLAVETLQHEDSENRRQGSAATSNEGVRIYWNVKPNIVSESLRSVLQLPSVDVQRLPMILLDLPDSGAYYVTTIDGDAIHAQDIINFYKNPGDRRSLA